VWVDGNADGVSQADELLSLKDAGVAKLNLNAAATDVNSNGNWVGLTSSFEKTDGSQGAMADVWFQTGAAKSPELRDKVSGLAKSIAEFSAAPEAAPAGGKLEVPAQKSGAGLAAVDKMVDVLKGFDANGNALGGTALASGSQTVRAPGQTDSGSNGFLAMPK
jgi:trimeric autotransporter adhesin